MQQVERKGLEERVTTKKNKVLHGNSFFHEKEKAFVLKKVSVRKWT